MCFGVMFSAKLQVKIGGRLCIAVIPDVLPRDVCVKYFGRADVVLQ